MTETWEPRSGRCPWCHGPDEGPERKIQVRSDWWHESCALDCLVELSEALE